MFSTIINAVFIFLLFFIIPGQSVLFKKREGSICYSTNDDTGAGFYGKQHQFLETRLTDLRLFEGCDTIIGNVVLIEFEDPNIDWSFFDQVRKITGYLVIGSSTMRRLPFPNLEIISGTNFIQISPTSPTWSLFIGTVNITEYPGLNSLREITYGSVLFEQINEPLSAYSNSINWGDIIMSGTITINGSLSAETIANNPYECHSDCEHPGQCWGPLLENCQRQNMVICSDVCHGARCYSKEDYPDPICCHRECAGGCTGPTNEDCFGCRNFNTTGSCVQACPPPTIYDKKSFKTIENPDVLYSLGNECLEECPQSYFEEFGNCVKQCSEGYHVAENSNKCVQCGEQGCAKDCEPVNFKSIKCKKPKNCAQKFKAKFSNCTKISGSIDIDLSFTKKFEGFVEEALSVLSTVTEVTGYISISTNNKFRDLKFLRNVKRIRGLETDHIGYRSTKCDDGRASCTKQMYGGLVIHAINDMKLQELRLNSLERVEHGDIIIYGNGSILCYMPTQQALQEIMGNRSDGRTGGSQIVLFHNETYCRAHEKACDSTCSTSGCWGPGPSNCVQCSTLTFEGQCVNTCSAEEHNGLALYENKTHCSRCDNECAACFGPGPHECTECKHFKDGPYCVAQCPTIKYSNESGVCIECSDKCSEAQGCTGPNHTIGPGGCNFCPVVRLLEETTANGAKKYTGVCEKECLSNQYADNLRPFAGLPTHDPENKDPDQRVKVCVACDELCSSCKGSGTEAYQCTCKYAQDDDRCVSECPPGKWKSLVDKVCYDCEGPCPNNCHGSDTIPVNRSTLVGFANCNLVEGSLLIGWDSWIGEDPITTADLEALNEIETITGRLVIRDSPDPDFTNLSMLKRLSSVGKGSPTRRKRESGDYIVEITNNTALETAELIALRDISGRMKLSGENLCYADSVNWNERIGDNLVDIEAGGTDCGQCHSECVAERGCLGSEDDMCDQCRNKEFQTRCVPRCEGASYDDGTKLCKACHENCEECTGPGNEHCTSCLYVLDDGACVRECTNPATTFEDRRTKECKPCDSSCKDGCTGPKNNLGQDGCNFCKIHDRTSQGNHTQFCAFECPEKSYSNTQKQRNDNGKWVYIEECLPCHEQCARCTFSTNFGCDECVKVRQGDKCQERCDDGFFPGLDNTCVACHPNCQACIGPGKDNCTLCTKFEIPSEMTETRTCAEECPDTYSFQIKGQSGGNEYVKCVSSCDDVTNYDGIIIREPDVCQQIPGRSPTIQEGQANTLIVVLVASVVIVILIVLVFLFWRKRLRQNQKKRRDLLKHAQHMHDNINPIYEPVVQEDHNYPINDGHLIIATEDELQLGKILGSGAFGKVYEGLWFPKESVSDENQGYPVAIKILKDNSDQDSTREFFDEAVVMAKLDHKHLVRIVCLCAGKIALVSQLLPLGSLLNYVRKCKTQMTPHQMLTYGHQIALGMEYLEENNVVHRDLAARNVLVQTPTFVKITDFGLAKMLASDKQMYTSEGGKLPIKWLALESLKYRQFTSSSDIWSYGVTMWEVLEFGQLPWKDKQPSDLIRSLETGDRLKQPRTCRVEVYALLLRCWVQEPMTRPNFGELVHKMEEFLKTPERFLENPYNNRTSTEGSILSPHASVTSEYRDSGIVDVERNYENDDQAMRLQRALYDATSTLRAQDAFNRPHYDKALTQDQDEVFSDSPSTARNSVVDRHDYVQDYLVPDQSSVDEGNGTDSSQDQGYVRMNGSTGGGNYTELAPSYSNTDELETDLTQSLLSKQGSKPSPPKTKFLQNRSPSPRQTKPFSSPKLSGGGAGRLSDSPRLTSRIRDDGYSCLKEPSDAYTPLTAGDL